MRPAPYIYRNKFLMKRLPVMKKKRIRCYIFFLCLLRTRALPSKMSIIICEITKRKKIITARERAREFSPRDKNACCTNR